MEYKKLGLTDLEVSRIGFGCWAIGGHGYGKTDDNESIKAIQKALDLGVNFFDTANIYGFGHSEEILSQALGPHKNKVVIATKFGMRWDNNGNIFKDCSPKRAREALEASLTRLKIDCIPLYQIHWYDNVTPMQRLMETLKMCQEEGKIRYIGCSNFSPELLYEVSKMCRVESLQVGYNITEKKYIEETKKCIDELKVGLIVYNVLARGLFSGKYGVSAKFDTGDTRRKDNNFRGKQFIDNLQLVRLLKQIGSVYKISPSQVAISWVLSNKAITSAIIGMKTAQQVEENVLYINSRLSEQDINIINSFADSLKRGE